MSMNLAEIYTSCHNNTKLIFVGYENVNVPFVITFNLLHYFLVWVQPVLKYNTNINQKHILGFLYIASYYRQLSAVINMKNCMIKTSLVSVEGAKCSV